MPRRSIREKLINRISVLENPETLDVREQLPPPDSAFAPTRGGEMSLIVLLLPLKLPPVKTQVLLRGFPLLSDATMTMVEASVTSVELPLTTISKSQLVA